MKTRKIQKAKGMNRRATDTTAPSVPSRSRRILVADDDEGSRCLISAVLEDAGFEVKAAADGQEAWEAVLQEPYDLLVTDNQMPRLTGTELIERIGEAGKNLPVIVVSGRFAAGTARRDPKLRTAAVLLKPFCLFELLRVVRHALEATSGDGATNAGAWDRRHAGLQPTH
jgi:two-component system, response regulator, stage 0 sporulation protein F